VGCWAKAEKPPQSSMAAAKKRLVNFMGEQQFTQIAGNAQFENPT
jgi:hypothetical protein